MTRLLAAALGLAVCGLTACGLAACGQPDAVPAATVADGPLAITDAFALPAPAGGTGGLYFTIRGGAEADTLRSVAVAGAERAEVHETYDAGDGMRGMRPVAGVAVAAGGETALAPGSAHIMLTNLAAALAPGDTLRAEATFDRAGSVPVVAVVRALGAMPHATPHATPHAAP